MRDREDRVVALASAIGINLLLLLLLLRVGASRLPEVNGLEESRRMQLRWLPRIVTPPPPQPASSPTARDRGQQTREASRKENPVPAIAAAEQPVVAVTVDDDDWGMGSAASESLDFESASVRRITGAPAPHSLEGKRVLPQLQMRDRSFGGALLRMTQRVDCQELRRAFNAAAHANPASMETIAASMQRKGCTS